MSLLGSKADLTAPKSGFRFTPESGLMSDIAPCLFRANSGHWPSLFDDLIGEGRRPCCHRVRAAADGGAFSLHRQGLNLACLNYERKSS